MEVGDPAMNDWSVYSLKVYKYHLCAYCHWSADVIEKVCPKCKREFSSTKTFADIEDQGDIRRLLTEQKEWIAANNPSEEEKEKALGFAKHLYNISLL